MSKDNGSKIILTEWIKQKADTITRWETDTGYNVDYHVEVGKIQKGIEEIRKFFRLNGIQTEFRKGQFINNLP